MARSRCLTWMPGSDGLRTRTSMHVVEEVGPSRKRLQVEIAAPDRAGRDRSRVRAASAGRRDSAASVRARRRGACSSASSASRCAARCWAGWSRTRSTTPCTTHQLAVVGHARDRRRRAHAGRGAALRRPPSTSGRRSCSASSAASRSCARRRRSATTDVERVLGSLRESVAQLRPITDRQVVEAGDVVTLNLTQPSWTAPSRSVARACCSRPAAGASRSRSSASSSDSTVARTSTLDVPYPADYPNPSLAGTTRALRGRGRGPAREGAAAARRRVRARSRSQRHARGAARTRPRRPRAAGDGACRWRGA